jgi:hypothetical protein
VLFFPQITKVLRPDEKLQAVNVPDAELNRRMEEAIKAQRSTP